MGSISEKTLAKKGRDNTIVITSGLPRCGTSMMMQMLKAGGMPVMTDHIRMPDKDNPRGYYEFEKVKKIKEDASWLENCHGKAVKMVSALLYHLPTDKNYKVIFMRRKMQEILASQKAMLQRLGQENSDVSDETLAEDFEKHLRGVKDWLARQSNIKVIYINYNEVIQDPYESVRLVARFLGDWLNPDKMSDVVEKSLYRKRIG